MANVQSLRLKFFGIFLLLVVMVTGGLSLTYYMLTKREKRLEFHQQINTAFDIILQELRRNITVSSKKLEAFSADTPILSFATSQYMQDPAQLDSVEFLTGYLKNAFEQVQLFGENTVFSRVSIYGADGRLLAFSQTDGVSPHHGGVFMKNSAGKDAFFPIDQQTSFGWLLSNDRQALERPLPEGVAPVLVPPLPASPTMNVFYEAEHFGIRMMSPVKHREQMTGMLVADIIYTRQTAKWYAVMTRAEINLFIDGQWFLGTLEAFPLAAEAVEQMVSCKEAMSVPQEMPFYPVSFRQQDYYQGGCAFDAADGMRGLLTIAVSRQPERQALTKLFITVLIVSLIALFVSTLLALWLSRYIVSVILCIEQVVRALAEGDLRNAALPYGQDELGRLVMQVNRMIEELRVIVSCVQRAELEVTSAAEELAARIKCQGAIMIQQVESADYVVNAVEAISSVTVALGDTMRQVSATAQETAEFANQGQTNLARMEEVLQHIGQASSSISEKLEIVSVKADSITSVVTTITSVADQTNLLSLNAAIEAEKAGESGRGFAVVAREIRRLADQTAVATLDIEEMVKAMQVAVSGSVGEIDRFISDVRQGAEDVSNIGTQLSRIIEQVQRLLPNFADISVVMGHQADNAQQIHEVILVLSAQMRETMESLNAAFEVITRLNDAANVLQNEISRFKV